MSSHETLLSLIKSQLPRLQDWEIEGLAKRLEEANTWVNVKDGLPEINGSYLCKWRFNERVLCLMEETPSFEESFIPYPYWWDENADQEIDWEEVTEWRYLPGHSKEFQ